MKTIKVYKVVRYTNRKYYSWNYINYRSHGRPTKIERSFNVRYYTDGRWITPKKAGNQFLFSCPTLDAAKFWLTGSEKTHQIFEVEIPETDLGSVWSLQDGKQLENNDSTLICSRMRIVKKIKL